MQTVSLIAPHPPKQHRSVLAWQKVEAVPNRSDTQTFLSVKSIRHTHVKGGKVICTHSSELSWVTWPHVSVPVMITMVRGHGSLCTLRLARKQKNIEAENRVDKIQPRRDVPGDPLPQVGSTSYFPETPKLMPQGRDQAFST